MKNLNGIIVYFSMIINAMNNPSTLYSQSLESIKKIFDEESVGIISRIYPHFFDEGSKLQFSGFKYIVNPAFKIPLKEIDLAELNIERIPIPLARQMSNIEKLDLSDNIRLKLNEEWFSYFFDNLKELSLNSCNLEDENLKAIANMKSLERLNLSVYIQKFDIKILKPILENLKHLNVSYCCFDISELEYILTCADKLESLNFNGNNLSKQTNLLSILSKNPNLKVLKLANCGLEFNDVENIIQLSNLEEVDFAYNNLKSHQQKTLGNVFECQAKLQESNDKEDSNFKDLDTNNNHGINSKSRLKKINFNHCYLDNQEFIKNLFNIEGLEVLKLARSNLNFDMQEILNCKAKNSLKKLNVSFCKIRSLETLKYLTDFKSLEILNISDNRFVDLSTDFSLGQSKYSLKEINMSYCKLNSAVFKSITECICLEKLNLSWSNLNNILRYDLNLNNLKNTLKELNLRGSRINHICFKLFTDCSKLEKIDFSDNDFSLLTKEYSLGCSKESLREINLKNSHFNQEILSDITDCLRLEKLNLSNNNFGRLPVNFKFGRSKDSLKKLDMSANNLKTNGIIAISECKKIERLLISENNFYDLPDNFRFGMLEMSLKELRICDSIINFPCLKAISECKRLESLNIRDNGILDINDTRVTSIVEKLRRSVKNFFH